MAAEAKRTKRRKTEQYYRRKEGIPEDLVPDILVRLPAKSLLRFKCVCKHWETLISSHGFAEENLKHITKGNDGRRIILSYGGKITIQSINYDPCSNEIIQIRTSKRLDFPVKQAIYLRVVGCCNGMLCLFMTEEYPSSLSVLSFIFWKPCIPTGFKVVRSFEQEPIYIYNYGFGYDKCSDDYKVVSINGKGHTAIYSMKGKRWYIDKDPLCPPRSEVYWSQVNSVSDAGTYVDGMIYGVPSSRQHLIGFDTKDDEFRHIALPELARGVAQLGVYQGCCLLATRQPQRSGLVEFWKLQLKVDDKKQLEGTKLMTIWSDQGMGSPPPRGLVPLCLGENGRALVGRTDPHSRCPPWKRGPDYLLWLYNPETARFQPQVTECELEPSIKTDWSVSWQLMTYVNTLVSPNSV